MFNSFLICILALHNKERHDANYALAIVELVCTAIVIVVIRNT